jgi:hypothetical protein
MVFEPHTIPRVKVSVLRLSQIAMPEGIENRFNTSVNSKQYNFLTSGDERGFIALLCDGDHITNDVMDRRIISYAFGKYDNHELELWEIGIFRSHALSDKRGWWGVNDMVKTTIGKKGKVRWIHNGTKLRPTNYESRVTGRANPYVVAVVYLLTKYFRADLRSVVQNSDMPCARLFHNDYCHATHPSIHLIYTTLGFHRSPLGNYVWYKEYMESMQKKLHEFLSKNQFSTE